MKTTHALMAIWFDTRATINKLTARHTFVQDAKIVLSITFFLFLNLSLFFYLLDIIPYSRMFSPKFMEGLAWTAIALSAGIYSYANLTALMLWQMTKRIQGKGSLTNTRTGILWSILVFLPLGFSFNLIYFAYDPKRHHEPIFLLDFASLLIFPIILIYSFIITLKIISEIQQFPLYRAFLTVLLCAAIQIGCLTLLFIFLS